MQLFLDITRCHPSVRNIFCVMFILLKTSQMFFFTVYKVKQ